MRLQLRSSKPNELSPNRMKVLWDNFLKFNKFYSKAVQFYPHKALKLNLFTQTTVNKFTTAQQSQHKLSKLLTILKSSPTYRDRPKSRTWHSKEFQAAAQVAMVNMSKIHLNNLLQTHNIIKFIHSSFRPIKKFTWNKDPIIPINTLTPKVQTLIRMFNITKNHKPMKSFFTCKTFSHKIIQTK